MDTMVNKVPNTSALELFLICANIRYLKLEMPNETKLNSSSVREAKEDLRRYACKVKKIRELENIHDMF